MAAFAASTDRIRLGQMCTCMSYRNPAYLAKVAATIDHISGGRLEMGIGGGWYEHERRAHRLRVPGDPRAARTAPRGSRDHAPGVDHGHGHAGREALPGGRRDRAAAPDPGGVASRSGSRAAGEKVTLRIAAKYAKYTNFSGDAETFARKRDILREHCADLGTDFDAITLSSDFNVIIGATEAEVTARRRAVESRIRTVLGDRTAVAMRGWTRARPPSSARPSRSSSSCRRSGRSGSPTRSSTSRTRRTTARASSCSSAR